MPDGVRVTVLRYAIRIILGLATAALLSVGGVGVVIGEHRIQAQEVPKQVANNTARIESMMKVLDRLTTHAADTDKRLTAAESAIQGVEVNGSIPTQAMWRVIVCHMRLPKATLNDCQQLQIPLPGVFLQGAKAPQ
jgi:hypothetical protein